MTEQREREGHREHRIPNIFLSFPTLNSENFHIVKRLLYHYDLVVIVYFILIYLFIFCTTLLYLH